MRKGLTALIVLSILFLVAGCGGGAEPTATPSVTSTVASTATGALTPTPIATTGSETTVYTVKPGDTLGGIADMFGTTVEAIVEANDLADADFIKDGQELVIPRP